MSGKTYSKAANFLQALVVGELPKDLEISFLNKMFEEHPHESATILIQLSMKAGLKAWGNVVKDATCDEMKQLHLCETFRPKKWKQLTRKQRAKVLESHLFLKKKRCGKIKGRTVAGGNKQRSFIDKDDISSPTVSNNAMILSCIIDAEERRDVATIDIPNAFIQTRVTDPKHRALIKVRGILAQILVDLAPEVYQDYIHYDKNGIMYLILECMNAMYGTMIASLLYFLKFCATLKRNGFEKNPHDPCVQNRVVKGKQQTVCFHVDDCKLSHGNSEVNTAFIDVLCEEYESIFEDGSRKMKVHRGKVHEYLGITLDFTEDKTVKISMSKFIQEYLTEFDEIAPNKMGTKSCAAPADLFMVKEDSEKLSKAKQEKFHRLVAKVLFATKRARQDLGTAMSFLMTRTQAPDNDDWRKLTHMMRYVRGIKDLALRLGAEDLRKAS